MKAETIRNAGKQEEWILDFSCFPAFLIVLSIANGLRITKKIITGDDVMQKITTFLTYDNRAEEAVTFYVSIFKNSRINKVVRFGESAPAPEGSVMTVTFELEGQTFVALNGGPHSKFTVGVSLYVDCHDQEQCDTL